MGQTERPCLWRLCSTLDIAPTVVPFEGLHHRCGVNSEIIQSTECGRKTLVPRNTKTPGVIALVFETTTKSPRQHYSNGSNNRSYTGGAYGHMGSRGEWPRSGVGDPLLCRREVSRIVLPSLIPLTQVPLMCCVARCSFSSVAPPCTDTGCRVLCGALIAVIAVAVLCSLVCRFCVFFLKRLSVVVSTWDFCLRMHERSLAVQLRVP